MRTTITLPDTLYQKAQVRMKERDFVAFSDYLQHLMREDTKHLPVIYPEPKPEALSVNETGPAPAKKPTRHIPKRDET